MATRAVALAFDSAKTSIDTRLGSVIGWRRILARHNERVVPRCEVFCLTLLSSAEAYANNPASARVLEKAGFVLEGRLRKHVPSRRKHSRFLLYARTI